jgi:hypothetical protein
VLAPQRAHDPTHVAQAPAGGGGPRARSALAHLVNGLRVLPAVLVLGAQAEGAGRGVAGQLPAQVHEALRQEEPEVPGAVAPPSQLRREEDLEVGEVDHGRRDVDDVVRRILWRGAPDGGYASMWTEEVDKGASPLTRTDDDHHQ